MATSVTCDNSKCRRLISGNWYEVRLVSVTTPEYGEVDAAGEFCSTTCLADHLRSLDVGGRPDFAAARRAAGRPLLESEEFAAAVEEAAVRGEYDDLPVSQLPVPDGGAQRITASEFEADDTPPPPSDDAPQADEFEGEPVDLGGLLRRKTLPYRQARTIGERRVHSLDAARAQQAARS